MKPTLTLVAALLVVAATTQAADVYKEKDAKGNPVFTDRPAQLDAERLNVKTQQTDTVEAQRRHDEEMQRLNSSSNSASSASESPASGERAASQSAEDKARRCKESRDRYEQYMSARRLYESGAAEGERRYLTDAEIDAARANAKKMMDEFCAGQ
jgi:catalase